MGVYGLLVLECNAYCIVSSFPFVSLNLMKVCFYCCGELSIHE